MEIAQIEIQRTREEGKGGGENKEMEGGKTGEWRTTEEEEREKTS